MDLVDQYLQYMEPMKGSKRFHRFAMLTIVSALLERRVWLDKGRQGVLFPNIYTILVGIPATGKSWAADKAVDLFTQIQPKGLKAPHRVADKITQAALYKNMREADREIVVPQLGKLRSSPVFVYSSELAQTMEDFGGGTLTNEMIDFYDSKGLRSVVAKETMKDGKFSFVNPSITFLGCTAHKFLQKAAAAALITSGLSSRIIFVVEDSVVEKEYNPVVPDKGLYDQLVAQLLKLYYLKGPMTMTATANERYVAIAKDADTASAAFKSEFHQNYYGRKHTHIAKLSMCFAATRGSYVIELLDIERARAWIEEIEPDMISAFGLRSIERDDDAAEQIVDVIPYEPEDMSETKLHHALIAAGKVMPKGYTLENICKALIQGGKLKQRGQTDGFRYYSRVRNA